MDLDKLQKDSPLIAWLIPKVPLMIQCAILAILIVWLTSTVFQTDKIVNLTIPLFIILTIVSHYSPTVLDSVQYGLGFAMASVIFKFTWPIRRLS